MFFICPLTWVHYSPTEISYLENRFCNLALAANRYEVKNGNDPTPGNITEEKESEMEEFIDYAKVIMGTLGHKLFEPVNKPVGKTSDDAVAVADTTSKLHLERTIKNVGKVEAKENNVLAPVPESCTEITEGVHALIQSIFDPYALDDMIDDMIKDGHDTKITENPLNDNFYKKEFQRLWNLINHQYAYTVEFDSRELIKKSVDHIDDKMFVAKLQYTVTSGQQEKDWSAEQVKSGSMFLAEKSQTYTLDRAEGSLVTYDLIGKIAEGAKLTRRTVAAILDGIRPTTFAMFQNNPEEFITKAIRLINEQKATMIVEQITYNRTEGTYDSAIFTAEKNSDFSRAYRSKKNVQDYVFADGYAKDGKSVERRMAEDMDLAEEVCVYAKLPKGFSIPTPVGNYSPDWAIAFNKDSVKHIFFIAETKGTMETLNLKPIEQAKIKCAKKLFAEFSTEDVVYHDVDSYQSLLNIMESL